MTPRACIIDCDPGTDDAVALWLALGSPELDIRLVTVAGGNAGLATTTANARAIVALAGRAVPVVAGAAGALLRPFEVAAHVHGKDGLAGVRLPDGPPLAPGLAADAIRDVLRAAPYASVTLVGLGPVTNLALALAAEPALADRVAEIVLMSGAWGEGNITPAAEFNAWNDPEALQILLGLGRPLTMATLDLTSQACVTPGRIAGLAAQGRPGPAAPRGGACWQAALAILRALPPSPRMGDRGYPLHDPCAIAWLVAPLLFAAREGFAEMELAPGPSRGRTVIDRWGRTGRAPNLRLLETLDAEGFFALLAARIAALP